MTTETNTNREGLPPAGAPPHLRPITRLEISVSLLLRAGVFVSMALVLIGLVLVFAHHPDLLTQKDSLGPMIGDKAQFPHTVSNVAVGVAGLAGRALAAAGLLALIITPVMRVAVSIVAFAAERDWIYAALTLFVLLTLLASFFVGAVE